jgi:aconitate hydratase
MERVRVNIPEFFSFKTKIPIRITDVNYGGHVGNDSFLAMIQEARLQFYKHYGYSEINVEGMGTIMVDVAIEYKAQGIPLVVIAGKEYGTGSSRDWAAKGTSLLGIRAVIAESFERIHRSNLVGMGVLPLKFTDHATRHDLDLNGSESIDFVFDEKNLKPYQKIQCIIDGSKQIELELQVFTEIEIEYLRQETILHKVIRGVCS